MSSPFRVSLNILTSSIQVVVAGLTYFFLYQLLLRKLNIELLGVWSLVLSTSSLANLANFGVSTSVIRFVALYSKDGENKKILNLIFTASLFLLGLFSAIALLVFPFATFILGKVITAKYLSQAYEILPYSILCLIINAVAGVFGSALDGLQKNYIRNSILVISSLVLLLSTYFLISPFGLLGVAMAQVIQSVFSIIACYLFILIKLPHNPFIWRWSKSIFSEIFSYGLKFQFISLTSMINDPLTKIILTRFSGLSYTGYYEMASRLTTQIRSIIVSANQTLLPVIVNIKDKSGEISFYKKTFLYVSIFSFIGMTLLCLEGRTISILFFNFSQPTFLIILILLSLGSVINLLTGPSFYTYMATGNLKYLIRFNILLCVLNALFGLLLGQFLGGIGVILGWILSLVVGSFYIINIFHNSHAIKIGSFIKRRHLFFLIFSIFLVSLQLIFQSNLHFDNSETLMTDFGMSILFLCGSFIILKKDFYEVYRLVGTPKMKSTNI